MISALPICFAAESSSYRLFFVHLASSLRYCTGSLALARAGSGDFPWILGVESELARLMLLNRHRSSGKPFWVAQPLRNPAIPGVK
ncbi:hypothetical protein [Ensifer sp. B1-9]|uniref:hypothetical protein n=1 Tax=Ensifer sp. B1-9 TaxID=3141455 RepID=UPI003D21DBFC